MNEHDVVNEIRRSNNVTRPVKVVSLSQSLMIWLILTAAVQSCINTKDVEKAVDRVQQEVHMLRTQGCAK